VHVSEATVRQLASEDPDAAVADLWGRYVVDRDTALRDRLILHYAPLVKYVAGRVGSGLPAHVEQADLVSYGTFGLIDAITRFEPSREIKFESYAMSRIRGAIIDELRSTDWIPRSVRMKARQFEKTVAALESRLHRSPTEEEIADEMEMDVEEIRKFLGQLSLVNVVALDELLVDDDGSAPRLVDTLQDSSALDPQAMAEHGEARQLLARAVEQLPEREKVVVSLYYFEGLTLADIGRVLGVTESRICQLHTKAVLHLRGKLADIA
jgi:RNA polymerase sigma factor for flagellar operon FliA